VLGHRFTDKTDEVAFGAVLLEVVCGRRADDSRVRSHEDVILMERVMKLGLLCSHPDPGYSRPLMLQAVLQGFRVSVFRV
jgi:hypothetical protein